MADTALLQNIQVEYTVTSQLLQEQLVILHSHTLLGKTSMEKRMQSTGTVMDYKETLQRTQYDTELHL